jgi:hypothetical protein
MLGDGVISSSESSAGDVLFHDPSPDPERIAASTFFYLRELCQSEWSFYAFLSLFQPQEAEAARRSLTVIT